MPARLFTRHAANRSLPLISRIVSDLQETQCGMEQARAFGDLGNPLFRELQGKMHLLHAELEDLGCFFTTANDRTGHVEFPAETGERRSYFCWQPGEEEVTRLRSEDDAPPPIAPTAPPATEKALPPRRRAPH